MQQQQRRQGVPASSNSSRCIPVLLVLVVVVALLPYTAAQNDAESCFLTDEQLPAVPRACNSTCRGDTLAALQGVYRGLNGPNWNFNVEDTKGEAPTKGGWPVCDPMGCRPKSV